MPRKEGDRSVLKIRPNEFIIADTEPHPLYFLKLAMALGSTTLLFLMLSLSYQPSPTLENGFWWWRLLTISGILLLLSYMLSVDMLPHHSHVTSFAHAWSLIYAFWWGITAAAVMKVQVEMAYPRAFWEQFLGLPSIAMIMFAVILFLFSGMLWRIDSYLSKKEPGPIGTISITLLAAGIAALFPPLWFLFSENLRDTFFMGTIFLTMVYWILLSLFLYYKGGMKVIFTNRRIITIKDFLGREVQEHPYDSIISVEILQGVLGERLSYGDLRFIVRRGRIKVGFTVHGIKNPVLVKNTVMALSSRERIRSRRKKHLKKPPRREYHLKVY